MTDKEKGVYPEWMDDDAIMKQLIDDITRKGRLPYTYVVNPRHNAATQERMVKIIAKMRRLKLLTKTINEKDDLKLSISGRKAAHLGYREYMRTHRNPSFWLRIKKSSFRYLFIFLLMFMIFLLIIHFF